MQQSAAALINEGLLKGIGDHLLERARALHAAGATNAEIEADLNASLPALDHQRRAIIESVAQQVALLTCGGADAGAH